MSVYEKFNTTDWVGDAEKENRVRLYRAQRFSGSGWKLRLLRAFSAVQSWLALALAGIIIGIIAAVMDIVTAFLADLRLGYCSTSWYLNRDFCCLGESEDSCTVWVMWTGTTFIQYSAYIFMSVLLAATASFLVLSLAPFAAGSGISEIKCIVAGFVMKGFLGFKTLVVKSVALPLTVASGFSVGKEGPSVHYAACVGNVVGRLFPKYRLHNSKRRELLTACTAAGVAVAFGSPIGGVLFSLEEIASAYDLSTIWRAYFCSLVSTGVLTLFNPFRTGQMVLFSVHYEQRWHLFELPFYLLLGVLNGFIAHFIIKWNLRAQSWRKKYWKDSPLCEVILIAAVTGAICYWNGFLAVDMTKSMGILFHECGENWEHHSCDISRSGSVAASLIAAFIIRTLLVIVSYGAKVPAGIFVPSMAIGALFGRLTGTAVWTLQSKHNNSVYFAACDRNHACIDPGTYAFLGAGALLSGVMHLTLTVVVIMFELTGALGYIIPTMIVVGTTTAVASMLDEAGIADQAIVANGYPFFMEDQEFSGTADEVMSVPEAIEEYGPIPAELVHNEYAIIDHDGFLIGSVDKSELISADMGSVFDSARCTTNRNVIMVGPGADLTSVHELFVQLGPRIIYVVDNGLLMGLISRKDLLRFHQETVTRESQHGHSLADQLERSLRTLALSIGEKASGWFK